MEGTGSDSSASRAHRDRRQLFMFSIALRPEFQPLCGQIIHRDPFPSLDSASDLVAEETCLHSLSFLASASNHPHPEVRVYLQLHLDLLQEAFAVVPPPPNSIVPYVRRMSILTVFAASSDLAITTRRQVTLSASISIIQSY